MTSLELAVDSIGLDLIVNQMCLDDWMPDWLIEHRAMDEEEARAVDCRAVSLRAICLRAREAEEVLKAEYGVLDPMLYQEEDQQ